MSFKYQGDSTLGVSLTVQTPQPLDTRLVVNTRDDLYDIPSTYAYLGMAVACITDGNIYTLIDKNSIKSAAGWKASYESVQIVTCKEEEYNTWVKNTNDDFTPVDDTQTWIHQDIYYYIYEDSISEDDQKEQFYVSYGQLLKVQNSLNNKAELSTVTNLSSKLTTEIDDRTKADSELKDLINTKADSTNLDNYYTKTETDDTFVTKDSLRGAGIEGDDFVFVTQTQYTKDQDDLETYKEETTVNIDNKVTKDSDASLNSLKTSTITGGNSVVTIGDNVAVNGKEVAIAENVPNIVVLDQDEYENLTDPDPDTYYMTHGTGSDDGGVVTSTYIKKNYYTQKEVIQLIEKTLAAFCEVNGLTNVTIVNKVEKPVNKSFIYDGLIHKPESTEAYDVIGEGGSEVGTYKFKIVLNGGYYWTNMYNAPIYITYTITPPASVFGDTFPVTFMSYNKGLGDPLPIEFS